MKERQDNTSRIASQMSAYYANERVNVYVKFVNTLKKERKKERNTKKNCSFQS